MPWVVHEARELTAVLPVAAAPMLELLAFASAAVVGVGISACGLSTVGLGSKGADVGRREGAELETEVEAKGTPVAAAAAAAACKVLKASGEVA